MPRLRIALLGAVLASAVPAVAAHAATPAQVIKALNQQRADSGIPAGIVENAEWSHDCALHDNWMAQNHTLSHQEQQGSPGYTDGGNWAGTHAVIASGTPAPNFHSPATNPYLNAPYHLAQLLDPSLTVMGVAEQQGFDCETTFSGYNRPHPATDKLYTYPGGQTRIPWLETARELPSVPGDAVGLPEGTTTGPNLIVYWDGPQSPAPLSDVRSASLKGPDKKKVAIRIVDDRNGRAFPGVGFVLPVKPLKPHTEYTAKVTFASHTSPVRTFARSWKFKTTTLLTGSDAIRLSVKLRPTTVFIRAIPRDPAYSGRIATLHTDYGPGYTVKPIDFKIGTGYVYVPRPSAGRTVKLTVVVHAFKAGGVKVKSFKVKKTVKG